MLRDPTFKVFVGRPTWQGGVFVAVYLVLVFVVAVAGGLFLCVADGSRPLVGAHPINKDPVTVVAHP